MKTNLREQLTSRYQCVIRPKVHFALEFSFKLTKASIWMRNVLLIWTFVMKSWWFSLPKSDFI